MQALQMSKVISDDPAYHPHCTRKKANQMLNSASIGQYILRESSQKGDYALSLKFPLEVANQKRLEILKKTRSTFKAQCMFGKKKRSIQRSVAQEKSPVLHYRIIVTAKEKMVVLANEKKNHYCSDTSAELAKEIFARSGLGRIPTEPLLNPGYSNQNHVEKLKDSKKILKVNFKKGLSNFGLIPPKKAEKSEKRQQQA